MSERNECVLKCKRAWVSSKIALFKAGMLLLLKTCMFIDALRSANAVTGAAYEDRIEDRITWSSELIDAARDTVKTDQDREDSLQPF